MKNAINAPNLFAKAKFLTLSSQRNLAYGRITVFSQFNGFKCDLFRKMTLISSSTQ